MLRASRANASATGVAPTTTIRLGCLNVLDKDPPLLDTINSGGNQIYAESNTFPSLYDTGGRYIFLNLTVDF
jgi:hypothetical protein